MSKSLSIYIDRAKIEDYITVIGNKLYDCFYMSQPEIDKRGYHCYEIVADAKKSMISFYYKADGTTTIIAKGENPSVSDKIRTILQYNYTTPNIKEKSFACNVSLEHSSRLIAYLKGVSGICYNLKKYKAYKRHEFNGNESDKLIVCEYKTSRLTVKSNSDLLFNVVMTLLSYSNSIQITDVFGSCNGFYNVEISHNDIEVELEYAMPTAYNEIDSTIKKLLASAVALRKINVGIEDYSCFAFSALRALEGYIKYLLTLKNVETWSFGEIFRRGELKTNIQTIVKDVKFKSEIEALYKYFDSTRHDIFHIDLILSETKLITDRNEAENIVREVIRIIEESYKILSEEGII